jgi:cytochrome bd-type quinol oxidase subunit 2
MDVTSIFSAFGLSASAGLNAYIPLLVVSLLAKFTNLINLEEPWSGLESWWIIGLLLVLSLVEFFADKVPAVNHINDIIQTIIRPVAGAIVFAASANSVTDVHPVLALAAGLLISGSVHVAKAGALRPAVTATTGGTGNTVVSMAEDALSTILSIISVLIPIVVGLLLVLLVAWFIWWFWRRTNRQMAEEAERNKQ